MESGAGHTKDMPGYENQLESPLRCVEGVTGGDLTKRIEAIMSNRTALRLGVTRRVALATVSLTALALPIVIGVMNGYRRPGASPRGYRAGESRAGGAAGSQTSPEPATGGSIEPSPNHADTFPIVFDSAFSISTHAEIRCRVDPPLQTRCRSRRGQRRPGTYRDAAPELYDPEEPD
jgi:hypothetical protein